MRRKKQQKSFNICQILFPSPQFVIEISRGQARCLDGLINFLVLFSVTIRQVGVQSLNKMILCSDWQIYECLHTFDSCGWLKTLPAQFLQEVQTDATPPILTAGTWTPIALKNNAGCPCPCLGICYKASSYIRSYTALVSKWKVWTQFRLNNTKNTNYECKDCKRKW